jgi:hypothetical protein
VEEEKSCPPFAKTEPQREGHPGVKARPPADESMISLNSGDLMQRLYGDRQKQTRHLAGASEDDS